MPNAFVAHGNHAVLPPAHCGGTVCACRSGPQIRMLASPRTGVRHSNVDLLDTTQHSRTRIAACQTSSQSSCRLQNLCCIHAAQVFAGCWGGRLLHWEEDPEEDIIGEHRRQDSGSAGDVLCVAVSPSGRLAAGEPMWLTRLTGLYTCAYGDGGLAHALQFG